MGGEKRKREKRGREGRVGRKVKMMIVQMPQQVMINEHWTEGKGDITVCKSKLIGVLYLLMITIFCNPISELAYQGIH